MMFYCDKKEKGLTGDTAGKKVKSSSPIVGEEPALQGKFFL
jgi:hypothetical protein